MKAVYCLVTILAVSTVAYSQSGRRGKEIKVAVPAPPVETAEPNQNPKPAEEPGRLVTAERNEDYRCTDDGTLERILDDSEVYGGNSGNSTEPILSSKESDTRVVITAKPQPSYTREARRNGIQGFVTLKVLLSGNHRVTRVRVLKGLRNGLTESAMQAACKMKFKPALKDGQPVSQWVIAEYLFRLSDSSIFRP